MSLGRKHKRPAAPLLPRTVDEAVLFLVGVLPVEDWKLLRSTPLAELGRDTGQRIWEMGIRNRLGLWGTNSELIAAIPEEHRFPDNASHYLAEMVWKHLQKNVSDEGTQS